MAEKIINLTVTHRSQTKGLAVETWQQIFWDASSIEDFEEFTTRARAHNRIEWDDKSGKSGAARVPLKAFDEALETRRRITLVCKAWYAMGIEILYSHVRSRSSQWKEDIFSGLSKDCPRLLAYTKRLALNCDAYQHSGFDPSVLIRNFAQLCSNLTRVKIIEVPGDLLPWFPLSNLPTTLEVALFDESGLLFDESGILPEHELDSCPPFPGAWTNIRVLEIPIICLQFCTLNHPVLFPVLEDLRIQEPDGNDPTDLWTKQRGVRDIGKTWTAPRLKCLTILQATFSLWSQFLRRHSETLTTLCLFTLDEFNEAGLYGFKGENGDVELPNLRTFYHDWVENPPDGFIANGVERIGIHDLGYKFNIEGALGRLCRVFGVWSCYPNITSCCVSGWETVIELLENEPKVIKFVAEMKGKGITVDFIRLAHEDIGY